MMHRQYLVTTVVALGVLVGVVGCNAQPDGPGEPAASSSAVDHQTEIEAQLAMLAPEDRERASTQKVCPISEEPLGSMGKPVKVTVDGQDLFICCAGCEDELKQNFAAHLEKCGPKSAAQLDQ